ncbi:MAG TPA: hypothetical protein VNE63_09060 [Candidatus Acidoferrales bacterium]|nr:hypothetical protein [Candidatus Acidoferrales bacterium]
MGVKETPKSKESEAVEKIESEVESEMEKRESGRREDERGKRQDLNQGMETGTHDSKRGGIQWGPSYIAPSKRSKPNETPEERKSNSDKD